MLVTSVIGLAFLPHGSVSTVITLQLLSLLLQAAHPERYPDKVLAGPGYHHLCSIPRAAGKSSDSVRCFYISACHNIKMNLKE
jgi:hypothetical protein